MKSFNINTILIILACIGFFIYLSRGKPEPPVQKVETKTTTVQLQPIYIESPVPASIVVHPSNFKVETTNIDTLIMMIYQLNSRLSELVTYDTTFTDSLSSEQLKITLQDNRIKTLLRNLKINNTTTLITETKLPTRRILAGAFALSDGSDLAFGPVMSFQNRRGDIFSVGKDALSKSWMGSVQLKISLRRKP
jgi:hypothetical protein